MRRVSPGSHTPVSGKGIRTLIGIFVVVIVVLYRSKALSKFDSMVSALGMTMLRSCPRPLRTA